MTTNEAKRIAELTQDAYSRDRYTDAGWIGVIKALGAEGATEAEIRWILESKHMRWAGDAANRNHSVTAADFLRYANSPHVGNLGKLIGTAQVELAKANPKVLRNGTETRIARTGADLAGACEGEQVADLIDLVRSISRLLPNAPIGAKAAALIVEIEGRAK